MKDSTTGLLRRLAGAALVGGALFALPAGGATSASDAWPRAEPAAVGVDAPSLHALDEELRSGKYPLVDSLFVARCGRQVHFSRYEHDYARIYDRQAHQKGALNARLTGPYNYYDPHWHPYFHGTAEHSMQSVSKTVTSIAIGIARGRGDWKSSLDRPVMDYFDAAKVRNVDARKRRMTVRDLLTMSAGLDWDEDLPYDDPGNGSSAMEATDDWVQFVIDRPMVAEPGSRYAYSSGATMVLAHIFRRETGQALDTYARRHLFQPLGIRDYYWKHTPLGIPDAEGGLYLRTEDLARLGELFLRNGRWHGTEVVPAAWIAESLQPRIEATEGYRYGYQWWLYPHGEPATYAWAARGFGGQRLLVFPEAELVIATTAWNLTDEGAALTPELTARIRDRLADTRCPAP